MVVLRKIDLLKEIKGLRDTKKRKEKKKEGLKLFNLTNKIIMDWADWKYRTHVFDSINWALNNGDSIIPSNQLLLYKFK